MPKWRRKMEERMAHLEDRIRREVQAERHDREKGEADTEEQLHGLETRLDAIENEQTGQSGRLRWLEANQSIKGRPMQTKKRTRKTDR
jgi:hypothetical protein